MSASLVDSMMVEMEQNNTPGEMDYQPGLIQSPIQQESQVRMGPVQYQPEQSGMMQHPTMQNPGGMQMAQQMAMSGQGTMSPETPDLEAPDLSKYGMDDEEEAGWLDTIVNEIKAPGIVIILAFLMTVPQINTVVRDGLSRLTENTLYINIMQAILIGVAFYGAMKLLV